MRGISLNRVSSISPCAVDRFQPHKMVLAILCIANEEDFWLTCSARQGEQYGFNG
jgi:hypothetical protein